jgi:uncharacterized protein (TIGR04255 family)
MLRRLVKRLKDPPLVEVACGFFFTPIARLDPILVGKYWAEQKQGQGFPTTQLQPPVTDQPSLFVGGAVGPLRCWLISEHEDYVLQIQPDRFYFNWRKREAGYPHFEGEHGILAQALEEFGSFTKFLHASVGLSPTPSRIELAKINLLMNPKHWTSYSHLTALLPMLGQLPQITADPSVNLAFVGVRGGFDLQFTMTNAVFASDMSPAVQIETRLMAKDMGIAAPATFAAMNGVANDIFFETVAEPELSRFGGVVT